MSQFEHDRTRFLSQEEQDAMRLAARGHAVLEVVALLEALGVEECAIETAVRATRERIADMPVDTLQELGTQAVSMVRLLDGEPLDAVESEEGVLPPVVEVTDQKFIPGPMRRVNPDGTYDLIDSVKVPISETERHATTVNPYINKIFNGILSFDELKDIESMEPSRRRILVDGLMGIYREVSHKPEYADVHGQRLTLMLAGHRVKEIGKILHTPAATIQFTFKSLGPMFERHPSGVREAYESTLREAIDDTESSIEPNLVATMPARVERTIQPNPSGEKQTVTYRHIKGVFEGILSDEDMRHIEQFESYQRDIFVGLLADIYKKVSYQPGRGDARVAQFRRMLDGLKMADIAEELSCPEKHIQEGRRKLKLMMSRSPDEVAAAFAVAKAALPPDETGVAENGNVRSESTSSEDHESEMPVDRLIENTFLDLMHEFDFGYSEVKGLIDRLKGTSNQTDSGLVKANIAFLTAARQAGELLDESESALLRAHLAPRPGRPPLSPGEIVESFKDIPGFDIDTVQRSIVGALAKLKGARS